MPAVQTLGQIVSLVPTWTPNSSYGSLRLYDQYYYDYQAIYRTQSNVRTVVDFLARNIAQLGLHVFRRVSDTDRVRLADHPLAALIGRPNPYTTRYRLIESLMIDLGIFFNAYWLKLQGDPIGLLRIPPEVVTVFGDLVPTGYEISFSGRVMKVEPGQMVHFRGHNPDSALFGLSPMETLRRILAEEHAMGDYREYYWRNAARMNGVIERPADAPEWSEAARERFKSEFEALYAGGTNSGKTAILEEGMSWKQTSFSARDSEYLEGRKLTREEVARAYHVPLPMVGILDHATFSNIEAQHKHLYQDCLGPWLKMIEEDMELQLLPDFEDSRGVYVEFNIAEKLAGSFEEQTKALQSSVGAPYMTRNEARARMNLPSLPDGDQLVTPLNVLVGGQASPRDSAPKGLEPHTKADDDIDIEHVQLREQHIKRWLQVMQSYFRRQEASITSRVPAKARKGIDDVWADGDRWDRELEADLLRLNVLTATAWADRVAAAAQVEYDPDLMLPWLEENARIAAVSINGTTRDAVKGALGEAEALAAVRHVFELAREVRAPEIAASKTTTAANFGAQDAAKQGGLKTKTWRHNASNDPRSQHVAMAGQTVAIDRRFSNGALWPGDPILGAEQNAHCRCSVSFGR